MGSQLEGSILWKCCVVLLFSIVFIGFGWNMFEALRLDLGPKSWYNDEMIETDQHVSSRCWPIPIISRVVPTFLLGALSSWSDVRPPKFLNYHLLDKYIWRFPLHGFTPSSHPCDFLDGPWNKHKSSDERVPPMEGSRLRLQRLLKNSWDSSKRGTMFYRNRLCLWLCGYKSLVFKNPLMNSNMSLKKIVRWWIKSTIGPGHT